METANRVKEIYMKIIIDRFEGDFAVAELPNGNMVNLPSILLENASEGDVVEITVQKGETKARAERISSLMDDLFD